jgi:hypothetical protein
MLVILRISNSRDIVNHNISTCFSEYQTVEIMLMIMLVLASQNINCTDNIKDKVSTCFSEYQEILLMIMLIFLPRIWDTVNANVNTS